MAPDEKKTFPAKTGNAGPPRRMEELPPVAFDLPDAELLDARQARISEVRRKAPELPEGEPGAVSFDLDDVPATRCDENEEGA